MRELRGRWRVERTLRDAELGEGRFRGSAAIEPRGGVLAWIEEGRLTLGGYDGPARRELLLEPDGAAWQVRFADGRPFHALDLRDGACAVEHLCSADRYDGEFRLDGPDAFEVRWRVRGPAKAQELRARYERA